jgi:hypothetical protein
VTPEPTGPTKLTVVDGINDYDAIRICFLPYPDGDPLLLPWPSAAEGLPFARAAVIDPIAATVPPGKDIRPVVFAGDLAKIADKTCAEALQLAATSTGDAGSGGTGGGGADGGGAGAGGASGGAGGGGAGGGDTDAGSADGGDAGTSPPPLLAAPLSVLPAAVFDSPRSILLIPVGCLGGPGHDGPTAALACGFNYSPSSPNASLVALGMSRIPDKTHVSFQVVNASAALQPSDVRLLSGFDGGEEWTLAPALALSTIAPLPPFNMIAAKALGSIEKVLVKTSLPGQTFASSTTLFTEAMSQGMVPKAAIVNGAAFTLIAVGGYPGVDAGAYGHKLTFTLIKSDP